MPRIRYFAALWPLAFLLAGCTFRTIEIDPTRAARDGNTFLRALMINHDYAGAARLCHPEAKIDAAGLRSLAEEIESKLGRVKAINAMSSAAATPGGLDDRLVVFYSADHERGRANVWIQMSGSARSGYVIGKLHWDMDPPPPKWPGMVFDKPIPM